MNKIQKILELKRKLQEIKTARTAGKGGASFTKDIESLLNKEANEVKQTFKDSPTSNAIRALAEKATLLEKKDPRIPKIIKAVTGADKKNKGEFKKVNQTFSENISAIIGELKASEARGVELTESKAQELLSRFEDHKTSYETDKKALETNSQAIENEVARVRQEFASIFDELTVISQDTRSESKASLEAISRRIDELEKEVYARILTVSSHGNGNANRSEIVGGNTATLDYYTDINWKAGTGITISYSPNHTTKYTDITITANGGGAGITREINSVAVDTVAGSTAGIDYVYLVSGTTTITLPTAVGNENLYTVKNVGSGVVTVDTGGGQTIDGDATVIMPTQYTSVDIVSDNANWNIT